MTSVLKNISLFPPLLSYSRLILFFFQLVSVDRTFFCHDLVTVAGQNGKKERCLFLMSDQIIVTSVKRKSAGALRKAGSLYVLFVLNSN